jgi:protein-tyrosine phosphatase
VTSDGAWPPINQANLRGHLQLAFADTLSPDDHRAFKRQHAHRILNFVRGMWDKIELLMVHCEAGVSRSLAVAAAISQIYLRTDGVFFMPHLYQPNQLVYDVLLETAWERGEYAGG